MQARQSREQPNRVPKAEDARGEALEDDYNPDQPDDNEYPDYEGQNGDNGPLSDANEDLLQRQLELQDRLNMLENMITKQASAVSYDTYAQSQPRGSQTQKSAKSKKGQNLATAQANGRQPEYKATRAGRQNSGSNLTSAKLSRGLEGQGETLVKPQNYAGERGINLSDNLEGEHTGGLRRTRSQDKDTKKKRLQSSQNSYQTGTFSSKNDPRLESEFANKVRDSNFILAKELLQKEAEVDRLRGLLASREHDLGHASNGIDRLGMREDRLLQELELLKKENALLEKKNQDLRKEFQASMENRHTEAYLMLENDHLRDDVVRLIKMLKTTKEVNWGLIQYKNFADYADASGSVHYLKSVGKFSRLDLASHKEHQNVPICKNHELFVDEKVLWVPQAAYKFAHEFRIKYEGKVTDNLIEHLLYELNKVWHNREKKLVAHVKSVYNSEAEQLRRQIAHTPSLELTFLQSEIKRLKQDLKNTTKDHRDWHAQRKQVNPTGMNYIRGAMKMANEFSTNKRELEKKNKYMQDVTRAYQQLLNDDYKGNIHAHEGSRQTLSGLKHEVNRLLQEQEQKSNMVGGSSKADLQQLDSIREFYATQIKRKLEAACNRVDRDSKTAYASGQAVKVAQTLGKHVGAN